MTTSLGVANISPVITVADNSDIVVMLLYYWKDHLFEIFFLQEREKKSWSLKEACGQVSDFKEHLLLTHPSSGCNSTSPLIEKESQNYFQRQCNLFPRLCHITGVCRKIFRRLEWRLPWSCMVKMTTLYWEKCGNQLPMHQFELLDVVQKVIKKLHISLSCFVNRKH